MMIKGNWLVIANILFLSVRCVYGSDAIDKVNGDELSKGIVINEIPDVPDPEENSGFNTVLKAMLSMVKPESEPIKPIIDPIDKAAQREEDDDIRINQLIKEIKEDNDLEDAPFIMTYEQRQVLKNPPDEGIDFIRIDKTPSIQDEYVEKEADIFMIEPKQAINTVDDPKVGVDSINSEFAISTTGQDSNPFYEEVCDENGNENEKVSVIGSTEKEILFNPDEGGIDFIRIDKTPSIQYEEEADIFVIEPKQGLKSLEDPIVGVDSINSQFAISTEGLDSNPFYQEVCDENSIEDEEISIISNTGKQVLLNPDEDGIDLMRLEGKSSNTIKENEEGVEQEFNQDNEPEEIEIFNEQSEQEVSQEDEPEDIKKFNEQPKQELLQIDEDGIDFIRVDGSPTIPLNAINKNNNPVNIIMNQPKKGIKKQKYQSNETEEMKEQNDQSNKTEEVKEQNNQTTVTEEYQKQQQTTVYQEPEIKQLNNESKQTILNPVEDGINDLSFIKKEGSTIKEENPFIMDDTLPGDDSNPVFLPNLTEKGETNIYNQAEEFNPLLNTKLKNISNIAIEPYKEEKEVDNMIDEPKQNILKPPDNGKDILRIEDIISYRNKLISKEQEKEELGFDPSTTFTTCGLEESDPLTLNNKLMIILTDFEDSTKDLKQTVEMNDSSINHILSSIINDMFALKEEQAPKQLTAKIAHLTQLYKEHRQFKSGKFIANTNHFRYLEHMSEDICCISYKNCTGTEFCRNLLINRRLTHKLEKESKEDIKIRLKKVMNALLNTLRPNNDTSKRFIQKRQLNEKLDDINDQIDTFNLGEKRLTKFLSGLVNTFPDCITNEEIDQVTAVFLKETNSYLSTLPEALNKDIDEIVSSFNEIKDKTDEGSKITSSDFEVYINMLKDLINNKIDQELLGNSEEDTINDLNSLRLKLDQFKELLSRNDTFLTGIENDIETQINIIEGIRKEDPEERERLIDDMKGIIEKQFDHIDLDKGSQLIRNSMNNLNIELNSDIGLSINKKNLSYIINNTISKFQFDIMDLKKNDKESKFFLDVKDLDYLFERFSDKLNEIKTSRVEYIDRLKNAKEIMLTDDIDETGDNEQKKQYSDCSIRKFVQILEKEDKILQVLLHDSNLKEKIKSIIKKNWGTLLSYSQQLKPLIKDTKTIGFLSDKIEDSVYSPKERVLIESMRCRKENRRNLSARDQNFLNFLQRLLFQWLKDKPKRFERKLNLVDSIIMGNASYKEINQDQIDTEEQNEGQKENEEQEQTEKQDKQIDEGVQEIDALETAMDFTLEIVPGFIFN